MAQGTDGLSRGALWECTNPIAMVPLHLSPSDRDPSLLQWCQSWVPAPLQLRVLSHQDWFTAGHGIAGGAPNCDGVWCPIPVPPSTTLLWHPAPAAAEAALEELCFGRPKHPHLRHIFLCPRLCTHTWRKRLFKFADFVFYLSPGFLPNVWLANQHEPVVIGVFLPIRDAPPWLYKGSPALLQLQQRLKTAFATRDTDLSFILSAIWS